MSKKLLIPLAIVLVILAGLMMWAGCKKPVQIPQDKLTPKTLSFWGVWDDTEDFQAILNEHRAQFSNVNIEYTKLKPEEYEQALLEAWAVGEGPDIFMVHNSWMREYQKYLAPMPQQIQMAKFNVSKNLFGKEETQISLQDISFPEVNNLQNIFVDVVADDAIISGQVYGLPLSVDTLALYYNKDLLNNEGIFLPPTVWDDFANEMVPELTKQDELGNIIQSGAALGTSDNIDRSIDILSLLMLQNGTVMINEANSQVEFAKETRDYNPGLSALQFYTDFASPAKEAYSWNEDMSSALETFVQGQLAFMFSYSYQIDTIEQRGTRLNYAIAPMLHINPDGTDRNPYSTGRAAINYANYWLLGAYKESDYQEEAWNFIRLATTENQQASQYLEKTGKPAALLSILNLQQDDPVLGVFARQALSAKSWYTGYDATAMEDYFKEMIDNTVSGDFTAKEALETAADQVEKTLRAK